MRTAEYPGLLPQPFDVDSVYWSASISHRDISVAAIISITGMKHRMLFCSRAADLRNISQLAR